MPRFKFFPIAVFYSTKAYAGELLCNRNSSFQIKLECWLKTVYYGSADFHMQQSRFCGKHLNKMRTAEFLIHWTTQCIQYHNQGNKGKESHDRYETGRPNWLAHLKTSMHLQIYMFHHLPWRAEKPETIQTLCLASSNLKSAKLYTANSTRGDWAFPCYMANRELHITGYLMNQKYAIDVNLAYTCLITNK